MAEGLFKQEGNNNGSERRFFANKKLNIALGVVFAVLIVAIAGLAIWVNI